MTTFQEWLEKSNQERIFLVEFSVLNLDTKASVPLYLSNAPYYGTDRQYLPCVAAIPTLSRSSGDLDEPGRLPTYGDISLYLTPEFQPDRDRSLSWNLILFQDDYSFQGQAVIIKMGGRTMDLADFQTIFTGYIGETPEWSDYYLTLTVYDKLRLLEAQIPPWEIPESVYVDENLWGQTPPLPLGYVKNMEIPYLSSPTAGQGTFVLAAGVINEVLNVYQQDILMDPGNWTFNQKEVSPAAKNADGSFILETSGTYSGSAEVQTWLLEIDDVSAGTEVGAATFKWSVDNGATWEDEEVLTWHLDYDPGSLLRTGGAGVNTITISGDYDDTTKRIYLIEITTGGEVGAGEPYPVFKWSDDDGVSWTEDVDIESSDPISLSHGLSVAFSSGIAVMTSVTNAVAGNQGRLRATATDEPFVIDVKITNSGIMGRNYVGFAWSDDGWSSFTEGNIPFGADEYAINIYGDSSVVLYFGYAYWWFLKDQEWQVTIDSTGTLEVGDAWEFTVKEGPILLDDGVYVQFYSQAEQDFYLGDQASFILWSTVTVTYDVSSGNKVTCDVEGLLDENGDYQDELVPVIETVLTQFYNWTSADFDTAAMDTYAAAYPYTVGYLLTEPLSMMEVLDDLLRGFPGIYSVDMEGLFYLKELTLPSGEADLVLYDSQRDFTDLPVGTMPEQNPKYRVLVQYDKNWTVNKDSVNVTQTYAAWLKIEYRQVSARDQRILQTYPEAGCLGPLESCVVERADAQALADAQLALFKDYHGYLEVQCTAKAGLVVPGDLVEVVRNKFGLDNGKVFLVAGTDFDPLAEIYRLTLWR